jgi:NAD(P)-dependent dehydrogenase (short-subunit alcohol dehydrogenase family)
MRLKDKVAVVTGGGSGIGRATCLLFAEEGAHVVVVDRYLADAEETVNRIAAQNGPRAIAVQTDVVNEAEVMAMAQRCDEEFGRVDILVNNAGVRVWGPVTAATDADWQLILDVNLKAPGLCCKHLIPLMARQGSGSIVNVSSANAVAGRPTMGLYDASKAGLAALTRSMACDHSEQGIRVNAILPGPTLTDFHIKRAQAAGRVLDESVTERNPNGPGIMKRQARPREIAYGILFLACDESSYVTGACLNVDGGLTAMTQRS